MASFGGGLSSLWDFNLPPALPEISDDQFLSLLNSQFTQKDQLGVPPPLPLNAAANPTANPAALTRFPPQQLNLSPLQSEEESPSPPGTSQDLTPSGGPGGRSRKQSQTNRMSARTTRSAASDEYLKRKASDDQSDDDDDEDAHRDKTFHGDDEDGPQRKNGRRKSTGGGQKSEDRIQKRKEQNRAAQRAFRERKEKHVRDLEDKVAMLEAKSDLQQAENENLRDLLGRLQNENSSLKQAQFTFSVSSNGDARAAKSPSSVSTQAASPSMSLLGPTSDGFENSMAYFSPTFFGNGNSPLPGTTAAASPQQADLSQYGIGAPYSLPAQSPYTTIAANPLYMSFSDGPGYTTYLSPPTDASSTPGSSSHKGTSSSMTSEPGALSPRTMHDIFGSSYEPLMAYSTSGYGDMGQGSSAALNPAGVPQEHGNDCPTSRQDLADKIATIPQSTLGPPVAMDIEPSHSGSQQPISATFMTPGEEEEMMATMGTSCDGSQDTPCHVFPAVAESNKNVSLNDAWERVSKHPQFQDCDMDELCALLTAQAKCDGSKPVLEPASVNGVMEKIPQLAARK